MSDILYLQRDVMRVAGVLLNHVVHQRLNSSELGISGAILEKSCACPETCVRAQSIKRALLCPLKGR